MARSKEMEEFGEEVAEIIRNGGNSPSVHNRIKAAMIRRGIPHKRVVSAAPEPERKGPPPGLATSAGTVPAPEPQVEGQDEE
jgi:hypothetical protein